VNPDEQHEDQVRAEQLVRRRALPIRIVGDARGIDWTKVFVMAWVIMVSLAVGWVVSRETSESERLAVAANTAALQQIQTEQKRQAAEANVRARALCSEWKGRAEAKVLPTTQDLGRVIVRTAAANYLSLGCEARTGKLKDGKPDAEAYRQAPPAPIPSPSPR
jgi:type II secretory pathway pseudopilin PulG